YRRKRVAASGMPGLRVQPGSSAGTGSVRRNNVVSRFFSPQKESVLSLLIHQVVRLSTIEAGGILIFFMVEDRQSFQVCCRRRVENNFTLQNENGAHMSAIFFGGEGYSLLVYRNLDDFLLNCICDKLRLVVDIELAHQVEFVCFHGL